MNDFINFLEPYKDYILLIISLFLFFKFVYLICKIFYDGVSYNTDCLQSDDNYIDTKKHVVKLNGDFFKYDDSIFLDESKHLGG